MKKIIKIFIIILIIVFIISLLYKKIILKQNIKIFGIGIFMVNSGSMMPEFDRGEAVITSLSRNYKVGDVITYNIEQKYFVTHRIIKIQDKGFITKGDFNNIEDNEKVYIENIEGKVIFHSKILGFIIKYIFYIMICLILLYIMLKKKGRVNEKSIKDNNNNINNPKCLSGNK